MAEFFGDLERLAADLYPWRYLIGLGILVVAAAIAAYGYRQGWHDWLWRRRLPVAIVGAPLLALVGFIAYDLGSPLFTNVTIEEEFPFAFSAVISEEMEDKGVTREDIEIAMAVIAKMDQPTVDEAMPDMTIKAPGGAEGNGTSTPPPDASPAEAGPIKLKEGDFRDADSFHRGSGIATIYRGQDSSLLLRLENLNVTNGPDLHVILSPHPDPERQGDLKTPGYIDLGKLKGNMGNQNYTIPDGVDVASQGSVVIYCMPFHVIFSVASLQDAA